MADSTVAQQFSVCGVKMKLYLPLACVALLSIGIAPIMAAEVVKEEVNDVAIAIERDTYLESAVTSITQEFLSMTQSVLKSMKVMKFVLFDI